MAAAEKALKLARSLHNWNAELLQFNSFPILTKKQRVRCADLRSAIDSFELCLEDGGPIPLHAWIARANSTINYRREAKTNVRFG
jgi:hypothetical protein